jgi:hypothetical protein
MRREAGVSILKLVGDGVISNAGFPCRFRHEGGGVDAWTVWTLNKIQDLGVDKGMDKCGRFHPLLPA